MATQTIQKGYGGKAQFTILASAARTTTQTSDDYVVPYSHSLRLVINVTSITSTPSMTVTIAGKTPLGVYFSVLVSSAITATGTTVLKIGPGIGQVANAAAADELPQTWRVTVTAADADSATYSVEAEAV